jgi:hypothetical protein
MSKEFDLGPTEVQKLNAAATDTKQSSQKAAQKALSFFENIAEGIKFVNEANSATEEYVRLLERAAKARGKQYADIEDLDLNAGKIVFKDREVMGGQDALAGGETGTTGGNAEESSASAE